PRAALERRHELHDRRRRDPRAAGGPRRHGAPAAAGLREAGTRTLKRARYDGRSSSATASAPRAPRRPRVRAMPAGRSFRLYLTVVARRLRPARQLPVRFSLTDLQSSWQAKAAALAADLGPGAAAGDVVMGADRA